MKDYEIQDVCNIHKLDELDAKDAQTMREKRMNLKTTWYENNAWHIFFVNEEGTRYIKADRKQNCYFDGSDEGYWKIQYGKIAWKWVKTVFPRYYEPIWVCANRFAKSANGTEIPRMVKTKKEVMAIVKAIGIFEI